MLSDNYITTKFDFYNISTKLIFCNTIINYVIVTIVLFALELQLVAYFYSVLFVGALAILLIIFLLVVTRKWKLFFNNFFLTLPMGGSVDFFFTEIYYIVASPLVEQLLYEYTSWCTREETITDFEYISSMLLSNEFVNQLLIAGLLLFLSFIGAVVLVFGTIYRKINERLTYIFLSIYFSSLAILLIYVLFLFLMDCNINITETFHTVSIVCKESISWCSAHAYIIRYMMELELLQLNLQ